LNPRGAAVCVWGLVFLVGFGFGVSAARVIPNRLDLAQDPGTVETYTLRLESDQEATEDLRLYLREWQRSEDGEHDWSIPTDGARWGFDRAFSAGEVVTVRYAVDSDSSDLTVSGSFRTGLPQIEGIVSGVQTLEGRDQPTVPSTSQIWIDRTVDERVVTLTVHVVAEVSGLTILEQYSGSVTLSSLDSAGGQFDSVQRSCTDWIQLSRDRVVLEAGASIEVEVTITTPAEFEGSYWSAIFVEPAPTIVEQEGTRVLAISRTAIKVFVTAPGTEHPDGAVTAVDVTSTAPLVVESTFENHGNVELVVTGELQVVDRGGETVRDLSIPEFRVLPGAVRVVSTGDATDAELLTPDVYQAIVQFEYGGDSPVVGVRGFRVR
jgi:hypothetical protein